MKRYTLNSIFFLLITFSCVAHSSAERIALIIGNSNYQSLGTLKNTSNDAKLIESSLRALGYKTKLAFDLTEGQSRKAMREFASDSENASVALIFYAGHGAQVLGENYLLPVDMEIPKRESDIQLSALKVDDILNSIQSQVKVVFLDACRDNPALIKSLSKGRGSFQGGLAPQREESVRDVSSGIFVAYATDSGNVALDGKGQSNSPFSVALSKYIQEPISIDDMFSKVSKEVRDSTGNSQRPYKYSSLNGIVCITEQCGNKKSSGPQLNPNNNASNSSTGNNPIFSMQAKMTLINQELKSRNQNKNPAEQSANINYELPDQFVLFGFTQDEKGQADSYYSINPSTIKNLKSLRTVKIFNRPVSSKSKDQNSLIGYWVLSCENYKAAMYEAQKIDKNGVILDDQKFFEPDMIELQVDFSSPGSIGNRAVNYACNPNRLIQIANKDELGSNDWHRAFTSQEGPTQADNYYSISSVNFDGKKIDLITRADFRVEQDLADFAADYVLLKGLSAPKYKHVISSIRVECNKPKSGYKVVAQQLLDKNSSIIYYINPDIPGDFEMVPNSIPEIMKKRYCS